MNDDDHITEPGVLTRIHWFFWRNWNRLVCATRGHDVQHQICSRCGLPVPTWAYIQELEAEIGKLRESMQFVAEATDEDWVRRALSTVLERTAGQS